MVVIFLYTDAYGCRSLYMGVVSAVMFTGDVHYMLVLFAICGVVRYMWVLFVTCAVLFVTCGCCSSYVGVVRYMCGVVRYMCGVLFVICGYCSLYVSVVRCTSGVVRCMSVLFVVLVALFVICGVLFVTGVIDPAKVTRCAMQNAASVAGMVLTTQAIVVEKARRPVSRVPQVPGMTM